MITREDCFKVGEVAKTHNLQGEVVITTDSDLLEKYADEPVFLLLDGAPVPFFIADEGLTVRNHTSYIVKFDYVDTLAQAGRLVGCEVLFEKELLEGQEPEESGYDIFELIGFEVKDQVSEETGEVADVDGTCGGYNLQWAFSSGTVAGRAIVKRNQELFKDDRHTMEENDGISERNRRR